MKLTYVAAAACAALITAPAALGQQSTSQPSFEDLLKQVQEQTKESVGVFQPLQGGGLRHVNSTFECPASLGAFTFKTHTVYQPDGSDVGCTYEDAAKRKMNYYIFKRPASETTRDLALGAARSIKQVTPDVELDKQATQSCQIGVGTAMMNAGHVKGDATAPPCIVFTKENFATLVSVWKRGDWNIKVRMTGPDTRIANDTAAVYALSHQSSGQAVAAAPAPRPATPPPAATPPKSKGFGKKDVADFCATSTTETAAGMQFNGKPASSAVMSMAPGQYAYVDNGAMLKFADGSYLVRLPDTRQGIFGTDGDDLIASGGIVGGCSGEQLSEVFERNKLELTSFRMNKPY